MQFINIIHIGADNNQYFVGLKVDPNKPDGQVDSHGFSYLKLREMYQKEIGWTMGLDNPNCPISKRNEIENENK